MTGPTNQDRYKEYWAYLRHIETLRFTMGVLIVTVVSALLAVVHLAPGGGIAEDLKLPALVFLALLVGVAVWFLVAHNKSYSHYFTQLQNMDESLKHFRKWGPFGALLELLALLQLAVIGSAFAFDSWACWEGSSWWSSESSPYWAQRFTTTGQTCPKRTKDKTPTRPRCSRTSGDAQWLQCAPPRAHQ